MTEFAFEPGRIEVAPGDIVRFVQEGIQPHNVEFTGIPDGALIDGVRMGPFLMAKGQTYTITIDERFPVGTYDFVCTPHALMGMTGTIVVSPAPDDGM